MNYQSKSIANELVKGIADGLFQTATDMLKSTGKTVGGFLEILMEPVYIPDSGVNPVEEAEKRRRKRKGQDQGLSR
jgi:hypothetical protein